MALAPNRPDPAHRIAGFCCRWVYLKLACPPERCLLTAEIQPGEVIPIPIAHGEGRFTTRETKVIEGLRANDQIVFQYCDAEGNVVDRPDVNPNGAVDNIAGICSPEGNVLAMMPHPERASFLGQVPTDLGGPWSQRGARRTATRRSSRRARPRPGDLRFHAGGARCAPTRLNARGAERPS
jgi:phosphoribosylformylglycinamidine (FGAM) synthase-like amidotransferase family enzyme